MSAKNPTNESSQKSNDQEQRLIRAVNTWREYEARGVTATRAVVDAIARRDGVHPNTLRRTLRIMMEEGIE